jgi:hypothetical protein
VGLASSSTSFPTKGKERPKCPNLKFVVAVQASVAFASHNPCGDSILKPKSLSAINRRGIGRKATRCILILMEINAIHQSLPPDLYDLFDATSMKPLSFTTIVDTAMASERRVPDDEHRSTQEFIPGAPAQMNVNRATLRQVLLAGMDDIVHFGKQLTHYECDEGGITATFGDGTKAKGNLLIGADGIRSAVRKQRVPHADTLDSGLRANGFRNKHTRPGGAKS